MSQVKTEEFREKKSGGRYKRGKRFWNSQENLLDEMQEQKLLNIEKNSFWFLYGMLFLAILIQIGMGRGWQESAAEMICFLVASVFLVVSCLRQGIWDRRLRADRKTNLKVSCTSALIVVLCSFLGIPRRNLPTNMLVGLTAVCAALTFVVTFALLGVFSYFYQKRKEALENGEDEEDA